ncbi:hypothetical protein GWO43_20195, partial [candidate division KSB1 bacterium]|nr:hypothetical protein [candidate division KSB1 bacterium]NIR71684.1 hypothetical protein [candidate division KSB1 bacterium]NIS26396.1 hypothetical protein [candidate division KSB1 bacterium]NIT73155.1 hypothetical protein [candidate division KSB1 bacterium]NIX72835.1 hypothetical protein [candidate division KSB1 bacterium]
MKKTPTKVPILTYHHVVQIDSTVDPGVRNSPFTLSREQFYAQMTFLSQNGYQVISMEQLFNMLHGEANGHEEIKKPIVLTFDDGWADNFA